MFKLLLTASVVICDLYLFHIISLLNPDFKLINNLISSSLDKVTAGAYNLQSFIVSVAAVGALSLLPPPMSLCSKLVIMQFLSHFNSKDTSQQINGMFSPLISCEVSLELKWDKNCIITSLEQRDIGGGNRDNAPTAATLTINDCKLYAPAVTLSKDDEIKLIINLKSGFKREIIWNKYRSQMTTEAVNNNLNILIEPTFTNVNRLFVLAYQNSGDRQSFSQFYLPNVMVKDYNVIIDKLAFF